LALSGKSVARTAFAGSAVKVPINEPEFWKIPFWITPGKTAQIPDFSVQFDWLP
jgi:hypothetical protein